MTAPDTTLQDAAAAHRAAAAGAPPFEAVLAYRPPARRLRSARLGLAGAIAAGLLTAAFWFGPGPRAPLTPAPQGGASAFAVVLTDRTSALAVPPLRKAAKRWPPRSLFPTPRTIGDRHDDLRLRFEKRRPALRRPRLDLPADRRPDARPG